MLDKISMQLHRAGPLLDIRSPMGISPIALSQSAPAPASKPSPQAKARQDMLAGQKSYRVSRKPMQWHPAMPN